MADETPHNPELDPWRDPSDGCIKWDALQRDSLKINVKGLVDDESLTRIQNALAGNDLALKHLRGFLDYANQMLKDSEASRMSHYDHEVAIVEYGGHSLDRKSVV